MPERAAWLDEVETRAWRGWVLMSNRLRGQIARDLLVDSGLSWADYEILVHLSEADGRRMRMAVLAARLDWSKSRVSHQVTRMERRGLLHREECAADARGAFAVLDPAGLDEIRRAAPAHVASVRRHFVDQLEHGQLDQLAEMTALVLEHLRTESVCTAAAEVAAGTDADVTVDVSSPAR